MSSSLPLPPVRAAASAPGKSSAREALAPFIVGPKAVFTTSTLTFYLNGARVLLDNPNPAWTLLDYIRSRHNLKGTKLGCGEGGCGACTVVLQCKLPGAGTRRTVHKAVNACLFPLVGVDGKHVITVEGLGNVERPHPLQERIAKLHGSQCGFCTPGIVMSLYSLIRNCYNPETKSFHISEEEIEKNGHLDGNLCRCTGYKPILDAAKTFIVEELQGNLIVTEKRVKTATREDDASDLLTRCGGSGDCCKNEIDDDAMLTASSTASKSCGRPGGCCRDAPSSPSQSSADESPSDDVSSASSTSVDTSLELEFTTERQEDTEVSGTSYAKPLKSREKKEEDNPGAVGEKTGTTLDAAPAPSKDGTPTHSFAPYSPGGELIYPQSLWAYEQVPLCFGDDKKIWFRPTTLEQLLELKDAYPSAKLVGGASEVQVEIKFKNSYFAVSVYVSDIAELNRISMPESEAAFQSMTELLVPGNLPLTELESICKDVFNKLGQRASALEALRKQLRYFAGRQIRNVSSLAGNIATASPISDACPVLLAAGASVTVRSHKEDPEDIPLSKFFIAYRTTALPPNAIITHIRIPLPPPDVREVTKAYKQAKRKDDDIAIVTAGFSVRLNEDGTIQGIRLAYGGMAPMPILAKKTMAALVGKTWFQTEALGLALESLGEDFDLSFGVPGGMAWYRKTLAMSLFFRFWHEVAADLGLGSVSADLVHEIHRDISSGTRDNYNPSEQRIVGKQIPHLSALKQCTGEAEYLDDMPSQSRELFGGFVLSTRAHAKLIEVDWEPALSLPGVIGYVDKNSVPKDINVWGSVIKDEPFFAVDEVLSHGQIIGMVYAETSLQAQAAAKAVRIVYEDLPVVLTIDEAISQKSFFKHGRELRKGAAKEGRMDDAFASCDRIFEGITRMGGQEHFYLETNTSMVIPHVEDGSMEVWSSTQNTMETQEFVSHVTGVPSNRINAKVKRMGGAFGGKESRSVPIACILAIAAKKEKRPMRSMLNRDEDMMTSGQRHPVQSRWKIGTTHDGKLLALDIDVYNNAGYSQDMSGAVMDRCCTHLDNCYNIPDVWVRGHVCRTNTHSNTAFRGFGGPQAMYIAESYMYAVAEGLNMDVDVLRRKNLYSQGDRTPFLQEIDEDWHIPTMLNQLSKKIGYDARKDRIINFNAGHQWRKRGISMVPCKFGISFATAIHLNQAAAEVKIYADGSILLNHGGTEMGQGLYTKMCQVAAQELNTPLDAIYTQDTSSYQTANASPTAASSGSDINGMAVKHACDQLNERLQPYREKYGVDAPMKTLAHAAYLDRVNLAANGFYKMPKIGFQWGNYNVNTVKPMYFYWTQGVACSEVELDLLTGDHTVLRSDIMMDVGQSINPAIDYGQIEGAFVQGQGLFTMEETLWTRTGELFTRGPGTYKIPGFSDIPQQFNVSLLRHDDTGANLTWKHLRTIQSSKGVGEPPLFLGSTVFFALREAVKAARKMNGVIEGPRGFTLDSPATAERLRLAVGDEISERAKVVPKEGETSFLVAVA